MGPLLFLYVALVGFFTFAAVYHLILWWSSRRELLLAVFGVDCALRAGLCAALGAMNVAATPAMAFDAARVRIALVFLTLVATLWCFRLISGVRARWFVWPMTIAFSLTFAIHTLVVPVNTKVVSVEPTVLPWGELVFIPRLGTPHWWVGPLLLLGLAVQFFGLYCGARLWARDRVAGTFVVVATAGTVLLIALEGLKRYLVLLAPVPAMGAFPHVLWVCLIALLIAREHRRTRERLATSEHHFRGIFDQTFEFIGLLTTAGTLIAANRTALEFAGVREADVLGQPFWKTPWWTHSPELQSRVEGAIGAAASGRTVRFETTHPRLDGRLAQIDFSLKPIHNDAGQITLLISEGHDITDRKQAEERRRTLEVQLGQAQKMEAIGQLAGGVAHDFNNLLTVINGYGELLCAMTPADDPRAAMLEGIRDAGERAAALTRQLLTFGRRQIVVPSVLDLNVVVVEAESILRRLIGEDIHLATVLDPDLFRVKADHGQIGQVIMNLAVNARDAMTTGGTMTIETANVALDETQAAAYLKSAGTYVGLSVTDTGCGMSAELQSRIFEPFFTTKGPHKGTGLGLATVRTIAEECGGFVRVFSEPDRGARFEIVLPALMADDANEPPHADAQPSLRGRETILLVEDEDAVRSLTCRILQKFGYTVVTAAEGAEAIRYVEQHPEPIELAITDVVMPGMGGRTLAEHLTRARPGLKVLFISGYTDDEIIRHGVSEADVAFLPKPFTVEALAIKVRQTLDAESPLGRKWRV